MGRLPAVAKPVFEAARKTENPSSTRGGGPRKRPASAETGEKPTNARAKAAPALKRPAAPPLKRPAAPMKRPASRPPSPPAEEPPAAAPAVVRQIDLAATPGLADAEAALLALAKAIAPQLQPHWIAGDGNCLYRSVALQMEQGEAHHTELRVQSVAAAEGQRFHYAQFFTEQTPEAVEAWARSMRTEGHWGDGISCRTLCDFIRRPVIIWRSVEPDQDPHCFVPLEHTAIGVATPVYLRLEEHVVGSEHYTALLWPPAPPAAAAGPAPKKRTPAEARGLHGLDAIGDWGKLGLTRAEYQALLDLDLSNLTPLEAMAAFQETVPDLRLTFVDAKFFHNMKQTKRREDAKEKFHKQLAVIEKVKAGVEGIQEVMKAVPGVGAVFISAVRKLFETIAESCWRAEFNKTFTVFGLPRNGRAWQQEPQPNEKWAAKAQEWMRVPSWIFCPECGRRELKTQVAWHWRRHPESCVQRPCPHGCDLPPQVLQQELEEPLDSKSLKAYVTPQSEHWQAWVQHIAPAAAPETPLHQVVPAEDLLALGLVNLHLDFATRRGGNASVTSRQKQTVIRASWKPSLPTEVLRSEAGRRAYEWLCSNNETYEFFVEKHKAVLQSQAAGEAHLWIPTAELLLGLPGLEVAARPWLYPYTGCGDTDIAQRLKALGRIAPASTPSLKTSSYRKVLSRCRDYASDFFLQLLPLRRKQEDGARDLGVRDGRLRNVLAQGRPKVGRHLPSDERPLARALFHVGACRMGIPATPRSFAPRQR